MDVTIYIIRGWTNAVLPNILYSYCFTGRGVLSFSQTASENFRTVPVAVVARVISPQKEHDCDLLATRPAKQMKHDTELPKGEIYSKLVHNMRH